MPTTFEDILKALSLDPKDRQIIELKHESELELERLKKDHGTELALLKKDHELDKLKTELLAANWENVKHLKLVQVRSFIDLFDDVKKLDKGLSRKDRFTKFAKENENSLKSWNLPTESFSEFFQLLYGKVCGSAHPLFNTEDTLEIGVSHLEDNEIQIMGFLWEMFPLPPEKLLFKMLGKLENVCTKYKKLNKN